MPEYEGKRGGGGQYRGANLGCQEPGCEGPVRVRIPEDDGPIWVVCLVCGKGDYFEQMARDTEIIGRDTKNGGTN